MLLPHALAEGESSGPSLLYYPDAFAPLGNEIASMQWLHQQGDHTVPRRTEVGKQRAGATRGDVAGTWWYICHIWGPVISASAA